MRGLPLAVWVYVFIVVALAAVLISGSSFDQLNWDTLAVLAVLFLVCDSTPALLNIQHARISLSFAAILASVVLLGPVGAALVGALALVTGQQGLGILQRLFNSAQFAICGWAAGTVYASGAVPRVPESGALPHIIGPYAAAVATYVAVNMAIIGGVLALSGQITVRRVRWRPVGELAVTYLGYGGFGLLIAGLWEEVQAFSVVLVLLPMFIARWAFAQTRAQQQAYDATIAALCQAVETKDFYTRGHSERVSRGSVMIAREIGMRPERVQAIRFAGMLHDIGKLGVPTKVLQKSGPLTEEEFAAIQLHPMRGLEIVREIGFLDEALAAIMHHHERMDGRGYPMGLAADEIPEFARVLAVADAFDSMTSTRSYRGARSFDEALAELRKGAGSQFDSDMVTAFIRALERDGWQPPTPVTLPEDDTVETTQQDHDDPSSPIKVTGEGVRW